MVKVLWFQQGGVHPAGTHRRHTELCQSLDVPAVGKVGPLTIHSSSNRAGSSFILPGEGFQRLRCDARPDPIRHTSNDKIRRLALGASILMLLCLKSRQGHLGRQPCAPPKSMCRQPLAAPPFPFPLPSSYVTRFLRMTISCW